MNRQCQFACSALVASLAACHPHEARQTPAGAAFAPAGSAKAAPQPATTKRYGSVQIDGVPHEEQKPDFCGEAVAAMYLQKLGQPYTQDQVFELTQMDPARGIGATTRELTTALAAAGFDVGPVWHEVKARRARTELEMQFAALHADLERGVPSIVCMHYDAQPNTTEHFRLVLGYDAQRDEVIYHEPAEPDGGYRRMARHTFMKLWPLKYDPASWTVIRFSLEPGELTKPPVLKGHSKADYAQHVMALKKRLPKGFNVVVEPPFVVIGDGRLERVQRAAKGTVRWATDHLKKDYFPDDPAEILDVWLFKNEKSYRYYTKALFDDEPDTPYGYYSPTNRALVMNIATGGGTLVHEIVHPFVAANFPDCPAWFNEGLGSLYEQSSTRNGHIIGLTNWRLDGLQRAIRRGRVPSFEALTQTTDDEFYNDDPGTNYAQARYLLYYLQEKELLVRYYHAFVRSHASDPTGLATLKGILGERDMAAFKRRWEQYVLGLSFP